MLFQLLPSGSAGLYFKNIEANHRNINMSIVEFTSNIT